MNMPPMAKGLGALFFFLLASMLAWTFDSPRAQALEIPRDQRPARDSVLAPTGLLTVTTDADGGAGSLRAAIASAGPGDTINFSLTLPATITLSTTELQVNTNLTINGPGASLLAVSGGNARRVFHIGANVTISGTTIRDGNIVNDDGGGIHNMGTLTLTNSKIISNTATNGRGGGIANFGTLYMNNSTVMSNTTFTGGGIYNDAGRYAFVDQSAFTGNNAIGGGIYSLGYLTITKTTLNGNFGSVSGIWSAGNSTLVMTNTTVSGEYDTAIYVDSNAPGAASAALWNSSVISNASMGILLDVLGSGVTSTLTLHNSIVASNAGGNFTIYSGTVTSLGYNLSDGTIPNATTGDQQNVTNIRVGALANNGGATQTMALLPGSPAINAGENSGCPATDQRGVTRPRTAQNPCDIGAFENSYLFLPLILK